MKYLFFLFLLFNVFSVNGQFLNKEYVTSSNTNIPYNLLNLDFDNDGDSDIVFYSFSEKRICWKENEYPLDYFKPSISLIDSVYNLTNLSVKDIDIDGDYDIAYSTGDNNSIYWIENLGQMNFTTPVIVSNNTNNAKKIDLSDVDGDGDLDIIAIAKGDNKIIWFEKIALGNFGEANIIDLSLLAPYDVSAKDMNNDGAVDIIACSREEGIIVWYENLNGLGSFSEQKLIGFLNDVRIIKVKDLNIDGYPDILAASYDNDKLVWYQNLGGFGLFSEEKSIINYHGFRSFDIADMDNDGDMDFLINSYNNGDKELKWFENQDEEFINPRILHSFKTLDFTTGDFNSDDKIDVVLTPREGLIYYKNTNNPDEFSKTKLEIELENYCDLIVKDYDNDGIKDIVTASSNIVMNKTLSESPYRFKSHTPFIIFGEIVIHKVELKDIDNDQDLDLIYCSEFHFSWRKNNGSGDFIFSTSLGNGDYNDFNINDIDNDGDLDFISVSNKLKWQEVENNDVISEKTIESWGGSSGVKAIIDVGDIDNDGDLDVLCAYLSGPSSGVYMYKNLDGLGSFSNQIQLNNTLHSTNIKLGDLDNDGNLDAVIVDHSGKIYWFRNMGGGTFSSSIEIPFSVSSNSHLRGLDIGDIDNDGDLDILTSELNTKSTYWLENIDGLANYNEGNFIGTTEGFPYTAKLYDFNDDGDLDVFTGSISDYSQVLYFENSSPIISISEVSKNNDIINVFPNPTRNTLSIKSNTISNKKIVYSLYDPKGYKMFSNKGVLSSENHININTRFFNPGVYILKIAFKDKIITKKIIVQ